MRRTLASAQGLAKLLGVHCIFNLTHAALDRSLRPNEEADNPTNRGDEPDDRKKQYQTQRPRGCLRKVNKDIIHHQSG
jgi:hypothetical protein